jgi:hypothetical protein
MYLGTKNQPTKQDLAVDALKAVQLLSFGFCCPLALRSAVAIFMIAAIHLSVTVEVTAAIRLSVAIAVSMGVTIDIPYAGLGIVGQQRQSNKF